MADTATARTGRSNPLGKLTEPVGPVKIPIETKGILEHEARRAGLTLNEFVRDLMMIRAHGEETIRRLYEERIGVVCGKAEES